MKQTKLIQKKISWKGFFFAVAFTAAAVLTKENKPFAIFQTNLSQKNKHFSTSNNSNQKFIIAE
jgi:hypothetical protein